MILLSIHIDQIVSTAELMIWKGSTERITNIDLRKSQTICSWIAQFMISCTISTCFHLISSHISSLDFWPNDSRVNEIDKLTWDYWNEIMQTFNRNCQITLFPRSTSSTPNFVQFCFFCMVFSVSLIPIWDCTQLADWFHFTIIDNYLR